MAFSDALRSGGADADVRLVADTGTFNAQIDEAERNWRESIASMSKESLKLDLAQDRLRSSLAKYGAESAQAKRATIALKEAEEQAARAADRHGRSLRSNANQTSSLRRNVIGLASAYVGVYGLVSGVRAVNEAYRDAEVIQGQVRIGVEALGIAYDQHAQKIDRVIRATSQLGFDDEELLQSFLKLVRGTGDVDVALERMALAAGVARGTFGSLADGTNVVVKAQLGMSGALRRAGLDVEKNASRTELLAFLMGEFGDAAVKAADDGAVAGERFAVEWENLQEILGSGVSPALADVSTRLADYLGDAENQAEIQRRVNEAVETGEEVVRGFAGAMRVLKNVTAPIVDLLGGTENAVRALILAMAVAKVLAFAGSLRKVGMDARFATGQLLAMAAASNAPMGRGFGPPGVGVSPAGLLIAGLVGTGLYGATQGQKDAIDGGEFEKLAAAARSGHMTRANLESLRPALTDAQYRALVGLLDQREGKGAAGSPDSRDGMTRGGGQGKGKPTPSGGGATGGPSLVDLELNLARAGTTAGTGDDATELRALRSYFARQIRVLEAKKNLTAKQKDELRRLYGEIASVQSQLDSIAQEEEDRAAEARRRAEEKRAAARAAQEKRLDAILDASEKTAQRAYDQRGKVPGTRAGMRKAALAGVDGVVKALKDKQGKAAQERALSEAEIRRMHVEFLSGLQGLNNQFGSNFNPDLWRIAEMTREQTDELKRLGSGVSHPGARTARVDLALSYGGVGAI